MTTRWSDGGGGGRLFLDNVNNKSLVRQLYKNDDKIFKAFAAVNDPQVPTQKQGGD